MQFPSLRSKTDLPEIYLTQVIYELGFGMIGVFIPIYLITLGYTVQQALVYLMIHYLGMMVLAAPVGWLTESIGLKKTTIVRIPFFLATYITLFLLPTTNIHFLVPTIFSGLASLLYWLPMNTLFLHNSQHKRRGKQMGFSLAIRSFSRVIAPAVAGVVAAKLGFPVLILFSLFIVSLSTVPLFLTPEMKPLKSFKWKDFWDMRTHEFVGISVADGMSFTAVQFLFPILIFVSLGSIETLGYILSLGTLMYAITSLFIGKLLDKYDKLLLLQIGMMLFAATIYVRPLFTTALGFSIIILLGGLTNGLKTPAYDTLLYEYAYKLKDKADEFIIVREIFLNLGKIAILGLAVMLPWQSGFFIAAAVLWLATGLLRGYHLKHPSS